MKIRIKNLHLLEKRKQNIIRSICVLSSRLESVEKEIKRLEEEVKSDEKKTKI